MIAKANARAKLEVPAWERDLTWRFQLADAAVSAVPSGVEVLRAICERGGPDHHGGGRDPGLPITQRQVDALDRARRIDAILAALPRHLSRALAACYGSHELGPALRHVFPYQGALACETAAARTAFEAQNGRRSRRAVSVAGWLESVCERVKRRKAKPGDELTLSEIRVEAMYLKTEAVDAYRAAAEGFERRGRRMWVI